MLPSPGSLTWKKDVGATHSSEFRFSDALIQIKKKTLKTTPKPKIMDIYEKYFYLHKESNDVCFMNCPNSICPEGPNDNIFVSSDFVKKLSRFDKGYGTGFVFLWAKLRFGVFNEYGKLKGTNYPLWFFDHSLIKWKPNVCAKWTVNDNNDNNNSWKICKV